MCGEPSERDHKGTLTQLKHDARKHNICALGCQVRHGLIIYVDLLTEFALALSPLAPAAIPPPAPCTINAMIS